MDLTGYVRPDGRVGFRNYLLIFPLLGCVNDIARRIADKIDGAIPVIHPHGCELDKSNSEWIGLQMERLATHPNVGGVVFVTLSCGAMNRYRIPKIASEAGKIVETVDYHRVGGTSACVEEGTRLAKGILKKLNEQNRQPVDMDKIIIGTKCGSSDNTSNAVLHPITGLVCDRIVEQGGTVVLAENLELIPDTETLANRSTNDQTRSGIYTMLEHAKVHYKQISGKTLEFTETAVSNSRQKAAKAGTKTIQRFIPLKEQIRGPGLVIHDGPNNDLVSVTTQAVAGCNLIIFTTGNGTPLGNPCLPVIKTTANNRTQNLMAENIDVGLGEVTDGKLSPEEGAERLYKRIIDIANGEPSKSEILGHTEIQFHIEGVTR